MVTTGLTLRNQGVTGRSARFARTPAWCVLVGMAVLALGASPAGAEVFVSNMNQAAAQLEYADYGKKEYAEGRITTTHERVYVPYASQRFGTGPNAAGYTLEEVRLDIVALAGSSSMAVALFSDNAGRPGSLMAEFHPVDGFTTGTVRLRARRQSGAYPRLQPNTDYHVEFQQRYGHVYWSITDSDVEDGANGWSLDDDGWSFISVSNHDETHGGVGLLGEMGRGEEGNTGIPRHGVPDSMSSRAGPRFPVPSGCNSWEAPLPAALRSWTRRIRAR